MYLTFIFFFFFLAGYENIKILDVKNFILFLDSHFLKSFNPLNDPFFVWRYISTILFWFFLGAFLHVIEDSLTGKVAFFVPHKRNFGFQIFQTGSIIEYFVSFALFFLAVLKFINFLR